MSLEAAGQSACMMGKKPIRTQSRESRTQPVFAGLDSFAGFRFNLPKSGFAAIVWQDRIGRGGEGVHEKV
jgi:hypothetical protein